MSNSKIDIENATMNIALTINGEIYLVGAEKDKLDAIEFLVKHSVSVVIPTGRTQKEFNEFLGYNK